MSNDNNSSNNKSEYRNLSEVFNELKQMQNPASNTIQYTKTSVKRKKNIPEHSDTYIYYGVKRMNWLYVLITLFILSILVFIFFPKNSSSVESFAKKEEFEDLTVQNYEINRKALNLQRIISENSSFERVKEQVVEEQDIPFQTTVNPNPSLPKGEEIITQNGVNGKENVSLVKTYENGELMEEIILSKQKTLDYVPKITSLGTSDFLAKLKIHINDVVYLSKSSVMKETSDLASPDKVEIKQYMDVKLLELVSEEICKVSFDGVEGYVSTSSLTSSYITPNITEKNRIQRILLKVNIDMALNTSSGLSLNDFKRVLSGLSGDVNGIFENNYTAFYNIDKKYNINGIFLASIAIHESGWGTSQIAQDKKNLFGYGAYDSSAYESSYVFETYEEGIELVAKSLVKYYINPSGTKIYDGEYAAAWYYNGPTVKGVNIRYASDVDWHTKVFKYMEMLYGKL